MAEQVELSSFDLRYEDYRLRNPVFEKSLLASILQYGVREPLLGIDSGGFLILLDGFKRYRCAKKLSISIVPYHSLSDDEALGIIKLLRLSTARNLNILEQAKLIDGLIAVHKMSLSEIAAHLEKSKSWVSMRSGLMTEMSESVREKVFSGKFPAYAFMYTLRRFMRMNNVRKQDIDRFVRQLSGKGLSLRDIDLLAEGYFRGPDNHVIRQQIEDGDIGLCLDYLKKNDTSGGVCNTTERKMLKELEITQRFMYRVIYRSSDRRLCGNDFYSQATVLASGILRKIKPFKRAVEGFNDRGKNP